MTDRIVGQFIQSNVFVVSKEKECVIVDAGVATEIVKEKVGGRKVLGVFLTHGHYDHCFYALEYAKTFGCEIFGSEFLPDYLSDPEHNYSKGTLKVTDFSNFRFLKGEGLLHIDSFDIGYIQLGGHSKSDMCYQIGSEIFVGDTIIGRDMGRIDLYGADKNAMKSSLEKLVEMKYEIMHSGHGDDFDKSTQDKIAKLWAKYLSR